MGGSSKKGKGKSSSSKPSSSKPSSSKEVKSTTTTVATPKKESYDLPPIVEWLSFTCAQTKSVVDLLKLELDTVLNEYVDKNLDQLLKENFVSARLTETIIKQFSQLTTKTILNLQEQQQEAWTELFQRFPKLKPKDTKEFHKNLFSTKLALTSVAKDEKEKEGEEKNDVDDEDDEVEENNSNESSLNVDTGLSTNNKIANTITTPTHDDDDEEEEEELFKTPPSSVKKKKNDDELSSPINKNNENLTVNTTTTTTSQNNVVDEPPLSPADTVVFSFKNKRAQQPSSSLNIHEENMDNDDEEQVEEKECSLSPEIGKDKKSSKSSLSSIIEQENDDEEINQEQDSEDMQIDEDHHSPNDSVDDTKDDSGSDKETSTDHEDLNDKNNTKTTTTKDVKIKISKNILSDSDEELEDKEQEEQEEKTKEKEEELLKKNKEIIRAPSPAETVVFSFNKNKQKNEFKTPLLLLSKSNTLNNNKTSTNSEEEEEGRKERSVSPCDTVIVVRNKKKTDTESPSSSTFLPPPSAKSTSNNKLSNDDNELSPPSPTETILFSSKKKNEKSDTSSKSSKINEEEDDDDKDGRKKVLGSDSEDNDDNDNGSEDDEDTSLFDLKQKKNLRNASSKTQNKESDTSSLDEQDDEDKDGNKKTIKKKKKNREMEIESLADDDDTETGDKVKNQKKKDFGDDPKLIPNDKSIPVVNIKRLSELIFDRLQTHKYIKLNPSDDEEDQGKKRRRRGRNQSEEDDPLAKAIRQLCSFDPVKGDKKTQSSKSSKGKSKDKTSSTKEKRLRTNEENSGSESEEDEVPLAKKVTKSLGEPIVLDYVDSDAEELDAGKVGSDNDSDEEAAKLSALKSKKKKALIESDSDESTDGKKNKKKGPNYYTPAVCDISNLDEDSEASEHSDDDDFISTKKKKVKKEDKDDVVVLSDSDSDSDVVKKKKNKKKKRSDSSSVEEIDDSDDSSRKTRNSRRKKRKRSDSSDSDSDNIKKKSRRRRVKELSDSSSDDERVSKKKKKKDTRSDDSDDSDIQIVDSSQASQSKGRKNIRQVMSKRDLGKQTRQAEEEEDKRKRRVVERQKQFNSFEKLAEADPSTILESLVLDRDLKTKEVLVQVDAEIVKKLKPHQVKGISFLWDSTFESVEQYKKPNVEGSGCILAHCMGLGKTLQTVAFLHTVITCTNLNIKSALVICPLNTVGNWVNEIKMWTRDADDSILVHKIYEEKNLKGRVQALQTWKRRGGIGVIHYDCFRALAGDGKPQKPKARLTKAAKDLLAKRNIIQECLLDYPDIVVADEGHLLKNHTSKTSLAVNQLRTKRRIVLTGTPLQNNLLEYHTMMQFVKPNLLGTRQEFSNRFVNPITNGQHADSDDADVAKMKKRAHVLHKLLDGCVQRLDYSVLVPYLPPKFEYVVLIKLSEVQTKLYAHYLTSIKDAGTVSSRIKDRKFLSDVAALSKVWNHPYTLVLKNLSKEIDEDSEGSMKDFIDDSDEESSSDTSVSAAGSDSDIDWLDGDSNVIANKKKKKSKVKTENGEEDSQVVELPPEEENVEKSSYDIIQSGGDWWSQFFKSKDDICLLEHSTKLTILFEILKTCESIGDKLLVFSQYLDSLNIIERFLEDIDTDARKRGDGVRWRKHIEYFRIDGSTKTEDRQRDCDTFNKRTTEKAKLFLISTKAGGLGINLVGANRVVIFDASWNPSQDLQSIFRIFRFGQEKPCYVYRLLAQNTMEEKIYNRQVVKLSLSGRVVDEHQIERHFKFDDIRKMYEFDPDERPDRPTPPVPKDRLLADLLISHKDMIDTYLEHDSLLQNQADEGLTEEERKVAWEEYEREKSYINAMDNRVDNSHYAAQAKIYQHVRGLYPNLPPNQLAVYVQFISKEMNELKQMTVKYHSIKETLTSEVQLECINTIEQKKSKINSLCTVPGYLANTLVAMGYGSFTPNMGFGTSSQTPQNMSYSTQTQNMQQRVQQHVQQLYANNYSGTPQQQPSQSQQLPIRISNSIFQSQESATPYSNVTQNGILNQRLQNLPSRPGILSRGIPTVTTPYQPNTLTASRVYSANNLNNNTNNNAPSTSTGLSSTAAASTSSSANGL